MIIDIHCHLGEMRHYGERYVSMLSTGRRKAGPWWAPMQEWRPELLATDVDRLAADAARFGIDRAVVFGFAAAALDTYVPAEYVAQQVARFPNLLIGFHSVDPLGGATAVEDARRAVREFGLQGIKLHPAASEVALDDERLLPIFEQIEQLNVPVIVHTGWCRVPHTDLDGQRASRLEGVASRYAALKLVLAHGGFPWIDDALAVMMRHSNVWLDTSDWRTHLPPHEIARWLVWLKQVGALQRVMFGSDYPIFDPGLDLEVLRSMPELSARLHLQPAVDAEDVAMIIGQNAQRLLGL